MAGCSVGIPSYQLSQLYAFYTSTNGDSWDYKSFTILQSFDSSNEYFGGSLSGLNLSVILDGSPWNFTSYPSITPNPCINNWQGIFCGKEDASGVCNVEGIILPMQGLVGLLPSTINQLSTLDYLVLNNNMLEESLEPLYSMSHLTYINVFNNSFTGTIPAQLSAFQNLTYLNFGSNSLHGGIPSELGLIASLQQLFLSSASLCGTIPSELSSLGKIATFDVSENNLSGELPDMSSWKNLSYLHVRANQIRGSIPTYLGALTQLIEISLQNNKLTGSIPSSIGKLKGLNVLILFNNFITGVLPSIIGTLSNLQYLLVQSNKLRGDLSLVFSSSLQNSALEVVDLSNNFFSKSLPTHLFALPLIEFISLSGNCFSGSLTDSLCKVDATANLTGLILNGLSQGGCKFASSLFFPTQVTGSIPSCLFSISTLTMLQLSGNGFVGTLPNWNSASMIGPNLHSLSLAYNRISGPIPPAFKTAPWDTLQLSNNHIDGTYAGITIFESNPSATLWLHDNRLSGGYPASFIDVGREDGNGVIFDGNLFQCPTYDPNHFAMNEFCESGTLMYYLYLFVAMFVLCGSVYLFCMPKLQTFHDTSVLHRETTVEILRDILNSRESETRTSSASNWSIRDAFSKVIKSIENHLIENKLWILTTYDEKLMGFEKFPDPQFFIVLLMTEVRRVSTILCLVVVSLFSIYIITIKYANDREYSTHTYQYGWLISLAFISGTVPAIVLFVLVWSVIILTSIIIWRSSVFLDKSYSTHSFGKLFFEDRNLKLAEVNSKFWTLRWYVCLTLPAINGALMVGLNAWYIYEQLQNNKFIVAIQIFLVIVKFTWNSIIIPVAITFLQSADLFPYPRLNIGLQLVAIFFNSLLAPCLAILFVDSQCFQDQLSHPDPVPMSYEYTLCASVEPGTNRCLDEEIYTFSTQFTPPFLYSDQCGSALVTAYIPVQILYFFVVTFISPILIVTFTFITRQPWARPPPERDSNCTLCDMNLCTKCHFNEYRRSLGSCLTECKENPRRSLGRCLAGCIYNYIISPSPKIFRPSAVGGSDPSKSISLMNVGNMVANITVQLITVVTFGAAFPPLAVIATIGIWSYTLQWQAVVGRFFLKCSTEPTIQEVKMDVPKANPLFPLVCYAMNESIKVDSVNCPRMVYVHAVFQKNCKGAWKMFERMKKLLIISLSLFFALFVFDMISSTRQEKYVTIPLVMLSIPIFAMVLLGLAMKVFRSRIQHMDSSKALRHASFRLFDPARFLLSFHRPSESQLPDTNVLSPGFGVDATMSKSVEMNPMGRLYPIDSNAWSDRFNILICCIFSLVSVRTEQIY